jgi:hypothetical protein
MGMMDCLPACVIEAPAYELLCYSLVSQACTYYNFIVLKEYAIEKTNFVFD